MIRTAIKQVGSKANIFTTIFVVVGSIGFAATQKVVISNFKSVHHNLKIKEIHQDW